MSGLPISRTLLDPAGYRRMPWKNGGGTTAEIALAPSAGDGDRFLWRVSIADVAQAGPFSAFPGYERLIAVVDGAGMRLTVDGIALEVRRREPALRFSGDARVHCALLDGPIRDFNLMVDRAQARGRLDVVTADRAAEVPAGGVALVHAVAGTLAVRHGDGATADEMRGDGMRGDSVTLVPSGWTLRLDGGGGSVVANGEAWGLVAMVAAR